MDINFLSQIDRVSEIIPDIPTEKLDDEILICECFCVNVRDIREACGHLQAVDLHLLQSTLSLGHGCVTCLKCIASWENKIF